MEFLEEWARCGEQQYVVAKNRLEGMSSSSLFESKAFYHGDCYKAAVNVTKINRLKSRIDKTGSSIPKRGRPSAASKEHESYEYLETLENFEYIYLVRTPMYSCVRSRVTSKPLIGM